LEKAMHKLSDRFQFEVEYFPYELNPQMPVSGVDQKNYLSHKFGGEERYLEITGHTTQVAEQEGLMFDFSIQKTSPNTRDAHRLIQFAKENDKQLELVEALFKAYFTEGTDLSKKENLVLIATQAGLDREETERLLSTESGALEIEMTERQLQQSGISGVPFYIINNQYGISGAQPSESFVKAFEEITASVTTGGESCEIDGENC
jgi:predicted DsbA family dithiol-disulfide isomerase